MTECHTTVTSNKVDPCTESKRLPLVLSGKNSKYTTACVSASIYNLFWKNRQEIVNDIYPPEKNARDFHFSSYTLYEDSNHMYI